METYEHQMSALYFITIVNDMILMNESKFLLYHR